MNKLNTSWYCPLKDEDVIKAITFLEAMDYDIYHRFKKDLNMGGGIGIRLSNDHCVIRVAGSRHDDLLFDNLDHLIKYHLELS